MSESTTKGRPTRMSNSELARLAREGHTPEEIGEAFGIKPIRVIDRLRRQGLNQYGEPIDLNPPQKKRQRVVDFNASNDDWQQDAACLGHDPELWFWESETERKAKEPYAKKVCGTCPVRTRCLEDAMLSELMDPRGHQHGHTTLTASARYGIRGGLNPEQRAKLAQDGAA